MKDKQTLYLMLTALLDENNNNKKLKNNITIIVSYITKKNLALKTKKNR